MSNKIPTIAAQWIATVVLPFCHVPEADFERYGLSILKGTSNYELI
jgi:hypothetical protein